VVEVSTRGNPRESVTETNRLRPPSHVNGGPARVKWCGKSAPASRRRGGWTNPARCKAKRDRLQVTRRGPGRPLRWMVAQRQNPAYRPAKEKPRSGGVFLCVESLGSRHARNRYRMSGAISMESLGAGAQENPGNAPCRTTRDIRSLRCSRACVHGAVGRSSFLAGGRALAVLRRPHARPRHRVRRRSRGRSRGRSRRRVSARRRASPRWRRARSG